MSSATGSDGFVRMLAPEAASVPQARHFTRESVGAFMQGPQRDNLELAVTEVFTNAVRHGAPDEDIRLCLTPKDGYMCVQVTDGGAGLASRPGALGREEGGYGLFFVELLTRRWGVTRESNRTRVWFEMDFDAAGQPPGSDGSNSPPKSVV